MPTFTQPEDGRSKAWDIIGPCLGFVVTVILTVTQGWRAHDIMWGLWLSSFCFGYLYMTVVCVADAVEKRGHDRRKSLLSTPLFLAFFTLHFGGFHNVHAMFLNSFFPLVAPRFGLSIREIFTVALLAYWPIALMTVVSRLRDIPLTERQARAIGKNVFLQPYVNVIRMHLMIFVLVGLEITGLTRFAIYPVIAVYFFPWASFFSYRNGRIAVRGADAPSSP